MNVWVLVFWGLLAVGVVCTYVGLVLTLRRRAMRASE